MTSLAAPPASGSLTREQRTELLALAHPDALSALADDFLAAHEPPVVIAPAEVGTVMMQVVEPVCRERFHLGEVAVTRAEVTWLGHAGWAMRLGTDRASALAAALCDALAQADPAAAARVDELCATTATAHATADRNEWERLATTVVNFEELDSR